MSPNITLIEMLQYIDELQKANRSDFEAWQIYYEAQTSASESELRSAQEYQEQNQIFENAEADYLLEQYLF